MAANQGLVVRGGETRVADAVKAKDVAKGLKARLREVRARARACCVRHCRREKCLLAR